jgi:hypothetical protein
MPRPTWAESKNNNFETNPFGLQARPDCFVVKRLYGGLFFRRHQSFGPNIHGGIEDLLWNLNHTHSRTRALRSLFLLANRSTDCIPAFHKFGKLLISCEGSCAAQGLRF